MNIKADFECVELTGDNGHDRRLPNDVEVTLYRIAQEALTNILRHANARHVSVVLLKERQEATLIIEDDGCGFDPAMLQSREQRPLGLMGMKERAQLLGGNVVIDTASGRGTTVRASVHFERAST